MKKIPPSKRIKKALRELLEQGTEGYVLSRFLRNKRAVTYPAVAGWSAKLKISSAEAIARGPGTRPSRATGMDNEPRKLKDVEGELELMIPRVRQTSEPLNYGGDGGKRKATTEGDSENLGISE